MQTWPMAKVSAGDGVGQGWAVPVVASRKAVGLVPLKAGSVPAFRVLAMLPVS